MSADAYSVRLATTHRDSLRKVSGMKNVPGPDYVMTYPYFILMDEAVPLAISVEGEWCICLFTDRDLVNQFHLAHRRDTSPAGLTVSVIEGSDRKLLIRILKEWKPELIKLDITRVAVDPTPERQVRTARIGDFIAMLQRQ